MEQQHSYTILIIEDNPGDALLIGELLEERFQTPHIQVRSSFQQARHLLTGQQDPFDVILLDLSLPDHSGEQLVKDMVSISRDAPIIIFTGLSDISFSLRSLSLGVSDYLFKDEITVNTLHKSIIYAIERKKLTQTILESEENYSILFHSSPQSMWVVDPHDFSVVQVNRAALLKYGYTREEFLESQLIDLKTTESSQLLSDRISDAPNTHIYKGRSIHYTKDKVKLYVEIYSNPIQLYGRELQLVMGVDVTEKIQFENRINNAIIHAQDTERSEIGSELHDNICQILTSSQLRLSMLKEVIPPEKLDIYHQTFDQIGQALKEIRNLSHRLVPMYFEDSTLRDTIEILLQTINLDNRYRIHLQLDEMLANNRISKKEHLNFYRVLQEQLNNIYQHANATEISIELADHGDWMMLRITDNGDGFDPTTTRQGIGLTNLRRRVALFDGHISILSSPGTGCRLTIQFPKSVLMTR